MLFWKGSKLFCQGSCLTSASSLPERLWVWDVNWEGTFKYELFHIYITQSVLFRCFIAYINDVDAHAQTLSPSPCFSTRNTTVGPYLACWCLGLPHRAICSPPDAGLFTCISRASRALEKLYFVPTLRWLSSALSDSFCALTLHFFNLREEYFQPLGGSFLSFCQQYLLVNQHFWV